MVSPDRSYTVRRATVRDIRALAVGMAKAFENDPHYQWHFDNAEERVSAAARLLRAHLHWGVENGKVYTTEGLDGGAIWVPNGTKASPGFARAYFRLGRKYPRLLDQADTFKPDKSENYAHLTTLCAFVQGQGIGAALLSHELTNLDLQRWPAFLEASSERSRDFYLQHGFKVIGTAALANGGPVYYPMWRDPQPPQQQ